MRISSIKRKIREIEINGKKTFSRWLLKINDRIARAKILQRVNRAEEGDFGDYKHVTGCIFELRIHYGPGYRVYFALEGKDIIILTWGGIKKTQNADISKALDIWETYTKDKISMKKKSKSTDFNKALLDILKDPKEASAYLNEALAYEGPHKEKYFLKSLRQVVEAHGMTNVSRKSSVSRRALYKALSESGNPTLCTIFAILSAINCHFKIG